MGGRKCKPKTLSDVQYHFEVLYFPEPIIIIRFRISWFQFFKIIIKNCY